MSSYRWALKWLISNINQQKVNLLNINTSYVNYFTVPLQRYSLHCFLLSHWCWSYHVGSCMLHCLPCKNILQSCVAGGAVLLAGRCLALARHQLKKAYWCWCFCDWQWYKKFLVLCPSIPLQWFKILHSFKGTTTHKCFVVWLFKVWLLANYDKQLNNLNCLVVTGKSQAGA